MFRDDYILRMATQFGQILAHVLGLSRRQQFSLALIAIDQALRELLGIGSDALKHVSESQLLALVKFSAQTSAWRDRGAILAALLREEGRIYAQQQNQEASDLRYFQALQIMLEIELSAADQPLVLPDYAPSVEELVEQLREVHLPSTTSASLFHYYEQSGAYAQAEDTLYELLATEPNTDAVLDLGRAFYARLLQQSDAALEAGNLPRAEIAAGLAELQNYRTDG